MTLEELIEELRRDVPEVQDVLDHHLEHLPGGDEFVLMGLLRDRALQLFDGDVLGALHRLLEIVDEALADGDEELADAVSSDFIADTEEYRERAAEVMEGIVDGSLRLSIGATFGLSDAAEAHRTLQSRGTTGSTTLDPAR